MGIRGEIYSTKVQLQNRTYFFNVKENRLGDIYLNIVESKNKDEGGFERQSVILFADDLPQFLTGFDDSLRILDKADREKKRGAARAGSGARPPRAERPPRPAGDAPDRARRPSGGAREDRPQWAGEGQGSRAGSQDFSGNTGHDDGRNHADRRGNLADSDIPREKGRDDRRSDRGEAGGGYGRSGGRDDGSRGAGPQFGPKKRVFVKKHGGTGGGREGRSDGGRGFEGNSPRPKKHGKIKPVKKS